uniref:Uncharacterized protein n=1 Tax=Kalanchoe fedtschenkoi TaxID=63787 RepID=A0A7N0U5S0_KALFE
MIDVVHPSGMLILARGTVLGELMSSRDDDSARVLGLSLARTSDLLRVGWVAPLNITLSQAGGSRGYLMGIVSYKGMERRMGVSPTIKMDSDDGSTKVTFCLSEGEA